MFRRAGNMPSKLWISTSKGVFLILVIVLLNCDNCHVSAANDGNTKEVSSSTVEPTTTTMMNDILFKNLSESFSMQELEDAMISLNRTKRQSLNLLQLAQLAGAGGGGVGLPAQQNTNNNSNGGAKQSPEGLLASCQLTNLLLYQIIQQRQQAAANPFLSLANANLQGLGSNLNLNVASGLPLNSGAVGGSLINPFPAINQNLIFPAATLTTYTTTSTFVTKLTTTAVLTIPLLFGNKPVPTTITRTKTYDVTTSEVKTLTSTVKPTFVTQVIAPTAALQSPTVTASPSLNDVDEDDTSLVTASVIPKKYQSSKVAVPEYEDEEPSTNTRFGSGTLSSKLSKSNARVSAKRRKPARSSQSQKPSSATTSNGRTSNRDRDYQDRDAQAPSRYGSTAKERDDYYETEYQPYGTSGKSNSNTNSGGFSKRKYGSIYEDDAVAVDEDPAAAQYPDDYSYYTKRLKRGEQYGDEETNDREYLLEPSTDGDFSSNYQKVERCPPIPKVVDPETVTVTRTETRTVTKFLGQSTLASNINLSGASRSFETPKPARKRTRSRNRDRSGTAVASSDQSAAYSAPAPTSERPTRGTTEDSRAHILSRSRSRYNSNSNNYQQQQPNYDYYRG